MSEDVIYMSGVFILNCSDMALEQLINVIGMSLFLLTLSTFIDTFDLPMDGLGPGWHGH